MQKNDSKKWCKNDQKLCPNGVKIDPKTIKRVIKNRCENRCENQCKTAPSKGGSARGAAAPLVVLSRHTLLLVSQTHIPTTNQTLKTARRHRYADARPDLKANASAADPIWEFVLVDFAVSVSIVSAVSRYMKRSSCECNARSVWYIVCQACFACCLSRLQTL